MDSESKSKKSEPGQEAKVGVKGNVKSLQQLSSSGRAAQEKRDINRNKRAAASLSKAFEKEVAKGGSSSSGGNK
ncbi:hypothetical protein V496_02522 [Pseudogymnoascus sp. VKM F-4515 (FW-2607)]|nr:hypothetical protein V496_02522 [Pseudogymnoascus sp. VKM F-4515 (FW-2607)]KFY95268.1 hypothetical protein V498_03440 [Pseudogymnoascus sp. VKM F-4517 (FW-2822)]KFZ19025.1 hypothetical protein V502_03880 [Pseudogymnoascus sp. VKM F-4520 (FW-2644)]